MNTHFRDNNKKVRDAMLKHRIYQYELANLLGVNEGTLCRKLRSEMPDDEQDRIVSMIEKHAAKTV